MSDAIHRGEHAERLLADPLLREALDTIKSELQGLFFRLPESATSERERLHLMDRMRQQFEGYLTALIANAKIEQSEILAESHMKARIDAIRRQTIGR